MREEIPVWRLTLVHRTPLGGTFSEVAHVEMPVPEHLVGAEAEAYVVQQFLGERRSYYIEVRVEPAPRFRPPVMVEATPLPPVGVAVEAQPEAGPLSGLVGKTITRVLLDEGHTILQFELTEGEPLTLEAEGDCCSESWFADITGIDALIGATVTDVEEVPMEVADGDTRGNGCVDTDCLEAYGWKLTTTKGRAQVVMRNSSNGYYGGYIEVRPPDYVTVPLVELTDDLSV